MAIKYVFGTSVSWGGKTISVRVGGEEQDASNVGDFAHLQYRVESKSTTSSTWDVSSWVLCEAELALFSIGNEISLGMKSGSFVTGDNKSVVTGPWTNSGQDYRVTSSVHLMLSTDGILKKKIANKYSSYGVQIVREWFTAGAWSPMITTKKTILFGTDGEINREFAFVI